ncbi:MULTISPECIES: hypothetical protein [unclassified Aureimonas]|uniref:hypothetical protein n=1 Tax=unclassified Aureimonas TaxID=2615206 RepID=UPI0006F9138B|nr:MULTISPECIES: hypothetical protein [unclassified Aureimonas]KQT64012.1 hypothetical protein ASG62_03060 [Aureimonas sp. Leaf427]KQT81205.1 hypothetical protein ASG54_00330 [Aureimonas sp. Leaf460]
MPAIKSLTLSVSVLVLLAAGAAQGASPAAPAFGGLSAPAISGASSAPAAPAFAPPAPPAIAPAAAVPVAPGANPFAPPVAVVPAPVPVAAQAAAPPAAEAPAFKPAAVPVAAAPAVDGAVADGDKVDEAALRYYASTRDLVRVGAEIRRLKALHPGWQPPADLFAKAETADESDLWALFAAKNFAGLDAAFAERAKAAPGWKPSADLAGKVAIERARFEMGAAAGTGDWTSVVAAAGRYPDALTCANIDLLWSLGEGYARIGNNAKSFDLYSYILKSCEDPAERLATVQKASQLLPPEGLAALTALGRPLANGSTEFASLRFDPVRTQMGKVASGESELAPDSAQLQAFADDIARSRNQGDALLFGWYLYAEKDFAGAIDWFKAAAKLGNDTKAQEGIILALRAGGQVEEAETFAEENRTRSADLAKVYVELVSTRLTENDSSATLEEAQLRSFVEAAELSKSALGAQSLGWNYLAKNKLDDARTWFEKSVEWQATKEGVTGLAIVAARSKNRGELREITAKYGDSFPELASVQLASAPRAAAPARKQAQAKPAGKATGNKNGGGDSTLLDEANAAFKARKYKDALALLDKRESLQGHNGGAEVLRGWANLKLGRFDEARRVFKQENSRRSTKDTRFGIGAVSNEQYNAWN